MCTVDAKGDLKRTSFSCLADHVLDSALAGNVHRLLLDNATAIVEAFGLIHGALERITLPAEQVIGVRAITITLETPYEGVRSARSPHAVELARVPDGLEGNLRHADRVRSWALRGICEAL
jgi:hypothetical protein